MRGSTRAERAHGEECPSHAWGAAVRPLSSPTRLTALVFRQSTEPSTLISRGAHGQESPAEALLGLRLPAPTLPRATLAWHADPGQTPAQGSRRAPHAPRPLPGPHRPLPQPYSLAQGDGGGIIPCTLCPWPACLPGLLCLPCPLCAWPVFLLESGSGFRPGFLAVPDTLGSESFVLLGCPLSCSWFLWRGGSSRAAARPTYAFAGPSGVYSVGKSSYTLLKTL